MKPDFLLINKYKPYLLVFVIYVIACIALAYWFASQLQQKQSEQWQFQLSSYSKAIVSKSDYVENLISGIASLYSASSSVTQERVKPLIDDQISGLAFDSSIEFYYRVTPNNVEFVEDYMQQVGVFDFSFSDSIRFSNHYENYVLLANYPESDFGHLVGSTISINNDNAKAYIVKEWPNSEFWSVILNAADVKTVSLRFNVKSFFDYIHASGDTQNQHITISLRNQPIYNSDWQNTLGLSSAEPLARKRISFFDKTLDIAYFNPSYVRHSHYLISAGFCTLAILFGFALIMYLVTIRNQYAHVNRLVRIKTYSLKKTQQNLAATSQLKVKALEQQLETKKKYKTLFVNCSEGLFCCNDKGEILERNPAFIGLLLPDDANNNICGLMSAQQQHSFLACKSNEFSQELFVQNKLGNTYCLLLKGHWVNDAERRLFEGRLLDITATKQHEEKLRYQAEHDALTDLLNRQAFLDSVGNELTRRKGSYHLLYVDLDRFKLVNDGYGHKVGDALLKALGRLLQSEFSNYGEVARLGGDEFALFIAQNRLNVSIESVVERLTYAIHQLRKQQAAYQCITASIGVRTIAAPCNLCPEQLLHEADLAMYRAKKMGRDQYSFYNDELAIANRRKREIETFCSNDSYLSAIRLVYQPIYCLESNRLLGFEALLRVHDENLGTISPLEFVPIIEDMAKISEVGLHVAKLAAHFCASVNLDTSNQLFVNVNVSPKQLKNNELLNWLDCQNVVSRSPLQLEITESAMMENQADIIPILECISDAGYHLLIDDFGTGYSSLARLKALPLNGLKIDRSFVNDLSSEAGLQIVKAICAIAKALNLTIVAEGVENTAQQNTLIDLHVDKVQGYLFSKPLECKDATELVNTQQYRQIA